jgi:hypothetical protein
MRTLSALWFVGTLSVSLVLFPYDLSSQQKFKTDTTLTIPEVILQRGPKGDLEFLSENRQRLLRLVRSGDIAKLARAYADISAGFDTSVVLTLYPGERLLVLFALGEYRDIEDVVLYDQGPEVQPSGKILPPDDSLFFKLQDYGGDHEDAWRSQIGSSNLSDEEKDFLLLLLTDLLGPAGDENLDDFQTDLNARADAFLRNYSGSRFEEYVRDNIRYAFTVSPLGYGLELSLGYLGMPSRIHLASDYGVVSLAGECAFENWYGSVRIDVTPAQQTKDPINVNGYWPKGTWLNYASILVSAGRIQPITRRLTVTPQLGFGSAAVSPPAHQSDDETNIIRFAIMGLGATLDFSLSPTSNIRLYAGVRFPLAYRDVVGTQYSVFSIGYSWFTRDIERDR